MYDHMYTTYPINYLLFHISCVFPVIKYLRKIPKIFLNTQQQGMPIGSAEQTSSFLTDDWSASWRWSVDKVLPCR